MVWEFADVFCDASTGDEVHYWQLVNQETGEVVDEKYVTQGE